MRGPRDSEVKEKVSALEEADCGVGRSRPDNLGPMGEGVNRETGWWGGPGGGTGAEKSVRLW